MMSEASDLDEAVATTTKDMASTSINGVEKAGAAEAENCDPVNHEKEGLLNTEQEKNVDQENKEQVEEQLPNPELIQQDENETVTHGQYLLSTYPVRHGRSSFSYSGDFLE